MPDPPPPLEVKYSETPETEEVPRSAFLFGCIDIIAAYPAGGVLAVQATSSSNLAARVAKAKTEPRLAVWLRAGGTFEAWGCSLRGARGRRKIWGLRRVRASLGPAGEIEFSEMGEHPALGAAGGSAS